MPTRRRAISFGDGHLQIVACAGSGKTETITRRVAYLVENGVPPGSIVAFTFTNRAADEMATRIRALLPISDTREDPSTNIYVGTIHSYCHQRLMQAIPKYLSFDLLDDETMRPIFCSRYFADLGLDNLRNLCLKRTSTRLGGHRSLTN